MCPRIKSGMKTKSLLSSQTHWSEKPGTASVVTVEILVLIYSKSTNRVVTQFCF